MPTELPDSGPDPAWDELLRQLRPSPLPEPRPFFYARVRARLTAAPAGPAPWWLQRPAYFALLALLVLGLNLGAVLHRARQAPASPAPAAAYATFVADYQLDPFTLPYE